MAVSRWSWVHPALFGLALTGLLINIAIHLATFDAPDLPANLGWLVPVYAFASSGGIVVSTWRRSSGLRLPVPRPPQSSLIQRLRAEFRAAPQFAWIVYGLGTLLWAYIMLLGIQFCSLLGTMKSEGYRLHFWSALGMLWCFQWTLRTATTLGWWGHWQTRSSPDFHPHP
jgi:hypothetical protein